MNIILEGPDASGKTLYAQKIVEYGYNYQKCSPGSHAKESFFDKDYFEKCLEKDNMVFDRFFISELIFSSLYNRKSAITFSEVNKMISKNLDNIKLIILYASDLETLKSRLIERGETDYLEEIDEQNKLFVQFAYVFAAYESNNIILIDVSKYNKEEDIDKTIKKIIGG